MKQTYFFVLLFFASYSAFGQSDRQTEITPQVLQKIKTDVEKQVPAFKKKLSERELSPDQVQFSIDTFRIEQIVSKRMEKDYSTVGMNLTMEDMASSYDKLMSKYYNKLIRVLKPEDKKILVVAQKAWLVYRNAETRLIATMTKDEYSGGGTIQSNIATNAYANLVVKRTTEIFNYYDSVLK